MDLPEPLKISLNYAEESSKRSRWIVFIMQLAVVLVIASVWAEDDSNWLQLRLNSAQSAVKLLTCESYNSGDSDISSDQPSPIQNDAITQIGREELNDRAMCANKDYLTAGERRQAIDYLKQWHFSLAQAKKNVADLQLMMANRVLGVTVPVLGVVFDINDLSIMAGVTFTILLSWFHFSLRRQHDNVKKVFELAGELDSKSKPNNSSNLKMAYDLLAMTQVLTIPPGASAGSRNLSLQRRLLRLPNLIMWTAVVAQAIVLTDDIVTMKHGDDLGVIVSHAETAIASLLLAYMTYRTIQCFRLMSETYSEWLSAYQKVYGAETRQADLSEQGRGKLAWLLLAAVLCVHLLGERPDAWTTFNETLSAFLTPLGRFFSQVSRIEEWLSIWLIVPLMAVLFWSSFIKRVRRVRLIALFLAGVVLLDAGAHIVTVLESRLNSSHLQHTMIGFYSLPLLVLAALNLVTTSRRRSTEEQQLLRKGHAQHS